MLGPLDAVAVFLPRGLRIFECLEIVLVHGKFQTRVMVTSNVKESVVDGSGKISGPTKNETVCPATGLDGGVLWRVNIRVSLIVLPLVVIYSPPSVEGLVNTPPETVKVKVAGAQFRLKYALGQAKSTK